MPAVTIDFSPELLARIAAHRAYRSAKLHIKLSRADTIRSIIWESESPPAEDASDTPEPRMRRGRDGAMHIIEPISDKPGFKP